MTSLKARLARIAISPDRGAGEIETLRLESAMHELVSRGATAFAFREKCLGDEEYVARGTRLCRLAREIGLFFIQNEREGLLPRLKPDAFHATHRSPATSALRERLGAEILIGRSTHSPEEVLVAEQEGCDYVFFGPVYATPSKKGIFEPRGQASLIEIAERVEMPVVGIGGFDQGRAKALPSSVAGAAMIRAYFESKTLPRGEERS